MSLALLQVSVELAQIVCGACGGTYAIAERLRAHHEEHGSSWHCPYCQCSWGFPKIGTLAQAQSALATERARHAATLARLNQEQAATAKLTRKLKRVQGGACPECNRTFRDLARHMACKHPKETQP